MKLGWRFLLKAMGGQAHRVKDLYWCERKLLHILSFLFYVKVNIYPGTIFVFVKPFSFDLISITAKIDNPDNCSHSTFHANIVTAQLQPKTKLV